MIVPFQIYRHFKGNLYLVISVALTESELEPTVVYMSLNGDSQVWTRPLSDFESLVPEDKENPTGQRYRFEQIVDMQTVLSHCTTKNLIEELKRRPDSPLNEIDTEGYNDKVADREYVLGVLSDTTGVKVLSSLYSSDSLEEVKRFAERNFHLLSSRTKIFKSILVEVESFD